LDYVEDKVLACWRWLEVDEIVLYPGNWLYNAGVIGFLKVLKNTGKCIDDYLKNSGEVRIQGIENIIFNKRILKEVKVSTFTIQWLLDSYSTIFKDNQNDKENAQLDEIDKITKVWGTLFNVYYRGFFNANSNYLFLKTKKSTKTLIQQFDEFVINCCILPDSFQPSQNQRCSFCHQNKVSFSYKNFFSMEHSGVLGSSDVIPNSFWNYSKSNCLFICDRCSFMLLNPHLSYVTLSDRSQIFINSPSFQVMWYLNQLIQEIYGNGSYRTTQELLGMSLIELSLRLRVQLGAWGGRNIEVITKRRDEINYYALPFETTRLLLDREIATLISNIGELSILQIILSRKYYQLIEIGERLMPLTLKNYKEWNTHETQYLNDNLRLQKSKKNISQLVSQIFNLYSLIKDKVGGGIA
jgi:CRISPR-associated protein Cst1